MAPFHRSDRLETDAAHALDAATAEEWLSIAMVAQKLSVSPWQVRKWIEAGQFDEIAVFSPRLMRISRMAYDRFVAKGMEAR